jgi:hypothetical protein
LVGSTVNLVISVLLLAFITFFLFFYRKKKGENRFTLTSILAFGFVLAGFIYGADRMIGFGLLAIGGILAIVEIFSRPKTK